MRGYEGWWRVGGGLVERCIILSSQPSTNPPALLTPSHLLIKKLKCVATYTYEAVANQFLSIPIHTICLLLRISLSSLIPPLRTISLAPSVEVPMSLLLFSVLLSTSSSNTLLICIVSFFILCARNTPSTRMKHSHSSPNILPLKI